MMLDRYAKLLREKALAFPRRHPDWVWWVREVLRFARELAGYAFEQTLDPILAEPCGGAGTWRWQVAMWQTLAGYGGTVGARGRLKGAPRIAQGETLGLDTSPVLTL
jgi:hypothetical protein